MIWIIDSPNHDPDYQLNLTYAFIKKNSEKMVHIFLLHRKNGEQGKCWTEGSYGELLDLVSGTR